MLLTVLFLAVTAAPGACTLLTRHEIDKTLQWHVSAVRESTYHLPQTSGELCTYDANEGTVLVTVPDHGSSFLQNNDLVDPFKNELGMRLTGVGTPATMFDSTVYLNKHGRSVSVAVLGTNVSADPDSLTAIAKAVARRMP